MNDAAPVRANDVAASTHGPAITKVTGLAVAGDRLLRPLRLAVANGSRRPTPRILQTQFGELSALVGARFVVSCALHADLGAHGYLAGEGAQAVGDPGPWARSKSRGTR